MAKALVSNIQVDAQVATNLKELIINALTSESGTMIVPQLVTKFARQTGPQFNLFIDVKLEMANPGPGGTSRSRFEIPGTPLRIVAVTPGLRSSRSSSSITKPTPELHAFILKVAFAAISTVPTATSTTRLTRPGGFGRR